jgi:hypothetical protein
LYGSSETIDVGVRSKSRPVLAGANRLFAMPKSLDPAEAVDDLDRHQPGTVDARRGRGLLEALARRQHRVEQRQRYGGNPRHGGKCGGGCAFR